MYILIYCLIHMENLNYLVPNIDCGCSKKCNCGERRIPRIKSGNIIAHFDSLEENLIRYINESDVIVGCVAWLTNKNIINALSNKVVQIVIQKEDFLRPDLTKRKDWTIHLKKLYGSLGTIERHDFVDGLSTSGCPTSEAVRCVGNYNIDKKIAFPRMHNKFIVFCKNKDPNNDLNNHIIPYAVWTGSFNFTDNSTYSIENALFIQDKKISTRYYQEWEWIFSLSEPLNWEKPWCEPEYRIGT